jgi:hypothetical protein
MTAQVEHRKKLFNRTSHWKPIVRVSLNLSRLLLVILPCFSTSTPTTPTTTTTTTTTTTNTTATSSTTISTTYVPPTSLGKKRSTACSSVITGLATLCTSNIN